MIYWNVGMMMLHSTYSDGRKCGLSNTATTFLRTEAKGVVNAIENTHTLTHTERGERRERYGRKMKIECLEKDRSTHLGSKGGSRQQLLYITIINYLRKNLNT